MAFDLVMDEYCGAGDLPSVQTAAWSRGPEVTEAKMIRSHLLETKSSESNWLAKRPQKKVR